ncbi:hypothetical protein B0H13DRAFT_419065 [Mycena leptocephala]|nr:hypothetical protein B0H13DRAFT_419065 [Mycena leptocephala]
MATRAVRPTKRFSLQDAHPPLPVHVCPSSGRMLVALAHAAPALVASPRPASPSSCTSYSSPLHRPFTVAVSVWAPLPPPTVYLLVDLRVRSSGACRQSTGRAREHFSGTDARWDVRSHHIDPQLPVFLVSYYRWSLHPARSRRSHRRCTFRAPPHPPPPLYLFSTLDTVTPPPSSISAPASILTPPQSFPMRARASVTETRNAPPRRTMQDAKCAGRRRDVEERGWMEGGYGGAGIGMERREEVGEEQGVGTEGGARRGG